MHSKQPQINAFAKKKNKGRGERRRGGRPRGRGCALAGGRCGEKGVKRACSWTRRVLSLIHNTHELFAQNTQNWGLRLLEPARRDG